MSTEPTLGLFQKHFAVMHCLYRLQPKYAALGQELIISPLSIQLLPVSNVEAAASALATTVGSVREFYVDWGNFTAATPDSVAQLLRDFWQRYSASDKKLEALEILELPGDADWNEIQSQYRRLIAEHHPDKGGDRVKFVAIRQAYEVLKGIF